LRILLYGRLADAIDRQVEMDAPDGCSVAEIRRRLASTHPAAADALRRSRACLRSSVVGDEQKLFSNDEIEFLPPVSGG
jgi:molybdopterin converting factor small subunit